MHTHMKTFTDRVHITDRADILDTDTIDPEERRRMIAVGAAEWRGAQDAQGRDYDVFVRIQPEERAS